jgi:TetR/AcrR family transcriptional regulator, transcriptional repressor for nem operon
MADVHPSRLKLLDASLRVMRTKGYNATRVEDLCEAAGVTKGSFFHHFDSKQEIGVAAADHWTATVSELFANAPYHQHTDPLQRVLAYIDFRKLLLAGPLPEITCLAGTLVQEIYDSDPLIRDACERCISSHAATLERDLAEAMAQRQLHAQWTAASLALHTQAVIQGALLLAKAKGDTRVAADSLDHLRRYIELAFSGSSSAGSNFTNSRAGTPGAHLGGRQKKKVRKRS